MESLLHSILRFIGAGGIDATGSAGPLMSGSADPD